MPLATKADLTDVRRATQIDLAELKVALNTWTVGSLLALTRTSATRPPPVVTFRHRLA